MPGRDITRLRSKWAASVFFLLALVVWAGPQLQPPAQSQTAGSQTESKPPADQSATPAPGGAATPQAQDNQPKTNDSGVFVFRKDVDEVLLHATVVDDKQRMITNLNKSAFTVFEDGRAQNIISFHPGDITVAIGLVIDQWVSIG